MINSTDLVGVVSNADKTLGNKARNLKEISTLSGVLVPRGVALRDDFSRRIIGLFQEEFRSFISLMDAGEASARINSRITSLDIPELDEWWRTTRAAYPEVRLFAVRSSGHPVLAGARTQEDSSKRSLAGQYASYLNLASSEVVPAIKRCISSLFNSRSLELFTVAGDSSYLESSMTVLVQEMIDSRCSGIMMTQDPVEGDTDLLGVEGGPGACSEYVDGSRTGDLFIVSKRFSKIVRAHRVRHPDSMPGTSTLSESRVLQLGDVGALLENHFGSPQDIEFTFDGNGALRVLQVRPITSIAS